MHKVFQTHLFNPLNGFLYSAPTKRLFRSLLYTPHRSSLFSDFNEVEKELNSSNPIFHSKKSIEQSDQSEPRNSGALTVQILHPWSEWVDLMKGLLKGGYFEGDRNPFLNSELGSKELNRIRTACLNFARDRCDLIRYLSTKDIHIIAECGCPSTDRKVVNSGKRLRAHVGIAEGAVCSSCNLRGACDRAYVKSRTDEVGRTVDVMRLLLTYGLDPISVMVENKPCLNKMAKESVRKLLKEMVKYSMEELDSNLPKSSSFERIASMKDQSSPQEKDNVNVPVKQGDWLCPKCEFLNFARNIKCFSCGELFLERARQLNKDLDHLPLKKGDWICNECNFLNFAKNSKCLQCNENPPKRHLNPGEWECESCNYINFRRNMVCLKCDHRRPKASSTSETPANGGYFSKLRFVRGEADTNAEVSFREERRNSNKRADRWRFIDNDIKDQAGFFDFPIAGGKSELSHNTERRETWKVEMLERRRGMVKPREKEVRSTGSQRRFEFTKSTDDDEMAEWFGC